MQVRDRVSDTARVMVRASVTIGYIRRFRMVNFTYRTIAGTVTATSAHLQLFVSCSVAEVTTDHNLRTAGA